jgi:hypothetical protein
VSGRSYRLVAVAEGVLELPAEVMAALSLAPGDLLSLEAKRSFLSLEVYRELLATDWECMSAEVRWHFLSDFLSRPLTAVEPGGRLAIPPDLLPLRAGEAANLAVHRHGDRNSLCLDKAEPGGA